MSSSNEELRRSTRWKDNPFSIFSESKLRQARRVDCMEVSEFEFDRSFQDNLQFFQTRTIIEQLRGHSGMIDAHLELIACKANDGIQDWDDCVN